MILTSNGRSSAELVVRPHFGHAGFPNIIEHSIGLDRIMRRGLAGVA
jgi:hypothetical protein